MLKLPGRPSTPERTVAWSTPALIGSLGYNKSLGYSGRYSIENQQQGGPYKNVQQVYDTVLADI